MAHFLFETYGKRFFSEGSRLHLRAPRIKQACEKRDFNMGRPSGTSLLLPPICSPNAILLKSLSMQASPRTIDLLIEPDWIIPIEPEGVVLQSHTLAVDRGRILDLLPTTDAKQRYQAREHRQLPGHVLLPGFVNLHTHAAMSLLRGYADDLPLMHWLEQRIWPAEQKWLSHQFVHDGTLLACWEMLRSGITCFNDMYFFPSAAAEAAYTVGIRAVLGLTILEFSTPYATDAENYLEKGLTFRDQWLNKSSLINFALAPHASYSVSNRSLTRIATLAAQLDLPIHIHLHETLAEIDHSMKEYGIRPLERFRRLGLLSPGLIAVHGVHLTDNDIDTLAEFHCPLALCPTSNMKLASGIPPIANLLSRGVRLGLGTDGAASNNRLDLIQEMRHSSLLAKAVSNDAACLSAHRALHMATLGGATALGLEQSIGSLIPGKSADLCAIDLSEWFLNPCYDPSSHLIYVAGREQVTQVWVEGQQRIYDSHPVGFSVEQISEASNLWHNALTFA